MALTIKELLASDTISQAADKINFNFDQLLLNGGGPSGPAGPIGPPGPIGGRGIRGTQWFEDPNTTGGATDPNTLIFPDLESNDSYLANDGFVWNYIDALTGWVNTGIDLTGPQGQAALGKWEETGDPEVSGKQILYPSLFQPAGQSQPTTIRSVYVGGVPQGDNPIDPTAVIPEAIRQNMDSTFSTLGVQVRNSSTPAIQFIGGEGAGNTYTNLLQEVQRISLLNGDILSFDDTISSTLNATYETGIKHESQNRSILTRAGRSVVIESNSTNIQAPLTNPGSIELRVLSGINNTAAGEIVFDNNYDSNTATMFIGTSQPANFDPILKTGLIAAEGKNIEFRAVDHFRVYTKGTTDNQSIFLQTLGAGGDITLSSADDVRLLAVQDILGTAERAIDLEGKDKVDIYKTSNATSGVQLETTGFWSLPNNITNRISLFSSAGMALRTKNEISITAGSDGQYSSATISPGAIGIAAYSGNIVNTILSTDPTNPATNVFKVRNFTLNDWQQSTNIAVENLTVTTDDKANMTILGPRTEGTSANSFNSSSSLKKASLFINTSFSLPSGYETNNPIIKIGRDAREASNINAYQYNSQMYNIDGYFGGGAHIVGPAGLSGVLVAKGINPNNYNNASGQESSTALHLRGDTKWSGPNQRSFNPGAVWLYTPKTFGPGVVNNTPTQVDQAERYSNSIRLWGTGISNVTRTSNPSVQPGITQGGITLGLDMLSESSLTSAAVTYSQNQGAGKDNVVGRITLYGIGTRDGSTGSGNVPNDSGMANSFYQSPNEFLTWAATGNGTRTTDVPNSKNKSATNYYASVNVGDQLRSRQSLKVFGEFVGDKYSEEQTNRISGTQASKNGKGSPFYFGPTIEDKMLDSGFVKRESSWVWNNAGWNSSYMDLVAQNGGEGFEGPVSFDEEDDRLGAESTYSWSRIGRVVTVTGMTRLKYRIDDGDFQDANFDTYGKRLLVFYPYPDSGNVSPPETANDVTRSIAIRLRLPTQLNAGNQSESYGGLPEADDCGDINPWDNFKGAENFSVQGTGTGQYRGNSYTDIVRPDGVSGGNSQRILGGAVGTCYILGGQINRPFGGLKSNDGFVGSNGGTADSAWLVLQGMGPQMFGFWSTNKTGIQVDPNEVGGSTAYASPSNQFPSPGGGGNGFRAPVGFYRENSLNSTRPNADNIFGGAGTTNLSAVNTMYWYNTVYRWSYQYTLKE